MSLSPCCGGMREGCILSECIFFALPQIMCILYVLPECNIIQRAIRLTTGESRWWCAYLYFWFEPSMDFDSHKQNWCVIYRKKCIFLSWHGEHSLISSCNVSQFGSFHWMPSSRLGCPRFCFPFSPLCYTWRYTNFILVVFCTQLQTIQRQQKKS